MSIMLKEQSHETRERSLEEIDALWDKFIDLLDEAENRGGEVIHPYKNQPSEKSLCEIMEILDKAIELCRFIDKKRNVSKL